MPHSCDTVALAADGVSATIALRGAEPLSWRVAGRELIWHGDPAHWPQRAPILFPVIGASAGGAVRVEGRSYPMPRHGFARDLPFGLVERRPDRARGFAFARRAARCGIIPSASSLGSKRGSPPIAFPCASR